mmetsp:Transcript_1172/g.3757  ORF Transcript_1172/g.3757 Transcript_1172/m.3757 type:complete len:329 (-) Transcript_1172:873-1859(-)
MEPVVLPRMAEDTRSFFAATAADMKSSFTARRMERPTGGSGGTTRISTSAPSFDSPSTGCTGITEWPTTLARQPFAGPSASTTTGVPTGRYSSALTAPRSAKRSSGAGEPTMTSWPGRMTSALEPGVANTRLTAPVLASRCMPTSGSARTSTRIGPASTPTTPMPRPPCSSTLAMSLACMLHWYIASSSCGLSTIPPSGDHEISREPSDTATTRICARCGHMPYACLPSSHCAASALASGPMPTPAEWPSTLWYGSDLTGGTGGVWPRPSATLITSVCLRLAEPKVLSFTAASLAATGSECSVEKPGAGNLQPGSGSGTKVNSPSGMW